MGMDMVGLNRLFYFLVLGSLDEAFLRWSWVLEFGLQVGS